MNSKFLHSRTTLLAARPDTAGHLVGRNPFSYQSKPVDLRDIADEECGDHRVVSDVKLLANIQDNQDPQISPSSQLSCVSEIPENGHGISISPMSSQNEGQVIHSSAAEARGPQPSARRSAMRRASGSDIFSYGHPYGFENEKQSESSDRSVPEDFLTPAALNLRLLRDLNKLQSQLCHVQHGNHLLSRQVRILNNERTVQKAADRQFVGILTRKDVYIRNLANANHKLQGEIAALKLKAEVGDALEYSLRIACDKQVQITQGHIKQGRKKDETLLQRDNEIEGLNRSSGEWEGKLAATEAYCSEEGHIPHRLALNNIKLKEDVQRLNDEADASHAQGLWAANANRVHVTSLETKISDLRAKVCHAEAKASDLEVTIGVMTDQNLNLNEHFASVRSDTETLKMELANSKTQLASTNREIRATTQKLKSITNDKENQTLSQRKARSIAKEERIRMIGELKISRLKTKAAETQVIELQQNWEETIARKLAAETQISAMLTLSRFLIGVIFALLLFIFGCT
ncbi:hypothetical protein BKA65DRAFT_471329 [Rhexocercosporidium sp. MPI-PUGE-AT-0058]|nr:hypothetical protein BKA65DRAFT_471329 [Rhexocercosporidium sp. MPI-PUGE-AT-0058]